MENYGEPPSPIREDSLQCKKHIMPEQKFFKLKVVVGQTVCKMQIIVARLFLYIWKLLLNVGRILSSRLMKFYVHTHIFWYNINCVFNFARNACNHTHERKNTVLTYKQAPTLRLL